MDINPHLNDVHQGSLIQIHSHTISVPFLPSSNTFEVTLKMASSMFVLVVVTDSLLGSLIAIHTHLLFGNRSLVVWIGGLGISRYLYGINQTPGSYVKSLQEARQTRREVKRTAAGLLQLSRVVSPKPREAEPRPGFFLVLITQKYYLFIYLFIL